MSVASYERSRLIIRYQSLILMSPISVGLHCRCALQEPLPTIALDYRSATILSHLLLLILWEALKIYYFTGCHSCYGLHTILHILCDSASVVQL